MQYRPLGSDSSMKVSAIALGTMSVAKGVIHSAVDEQQAIDTVHAALDHGINFLDTAPAYGAGESEERLGKALLGRPRDKYYIATKASGDTLSADEIADHCAQSLRRLRTDYIDLYQIHWPKRVAPLSETLTAMDKLVKQGKVRRLGVCNFGPAGLAEALKQTKIVSLQVIYSLLSRAAEFGVQRMCVEHGIGILCYSPLAQGLLTGRYSSADELPPERARSRHFRGDRPMSRHGGPGCERETFAAVDVIRAIAAELNVTMADLSTAWLLHQRAVASVLAGASRPEQVAGNVKAADIKLSDDVLKRLDAATAPVKTFLGGNLDIWQSDANSRVV